MPSTYLAYDAERLRALRSAMADADAEMQRIRCDDELAADAMRALRAARALLAERWIPLVDRIARCAALTDARGIDPDDRLVAVPWTMATEHGWQVAADPLHTERPPTPAEVATLARRLAAGDLDRLLDTPAERSWLAIELAAIGADVSLARIFAAFFDRWPALADALGRRRVDLLHIDHFRPDPATARAVAELDALAAATAAVWARVHPAALPDLDAMQPYSAALLLRHLRLDPVLMAQIATDLLGRWHHAEPSSEPWWDRGAAGPNTADLLFAWLATDEQACARFVATNAGDLRTVFASAADPALAYRVVLLGTDPAHVAIDAGGAAVLTILRGFARGDYAAVPPVADGYDPDWQPFLADLVAPWLVQFSPLASGWQATPDERRDLLAFVLDDERALSRIVAAAGTATAGLVANVRAGAMGDGGRAELAAFVGLMGELAMREDVADERERELIWNQCWQLAALPLALLPTLPGTVAGHGLEAARQWAADHGWLGAPNRALAAARSSYRQEWMLTVAGAGMVAAGFDRVVARRDVARATPRPPSPDPNDPHPQLAYEHAYLAWRRRVFTDPYDPVALELDGWKGSFLSSADAGRTAVRGG